MINKPNYTQCPNIFFDEILKSLSGSETKIFCVIMRKTFGWQKSSDRISYSQIMEMSGIMSKATVNDAIKSLETKGYVIAERKKQTTVYSVNVTDIVPVQKSNRFNNCTDTGTETVPDSIETGTKTVHTKESNLNKLSKEIYIDIETAYINAFKTVIPNGEPILDYKKVRAREKAVLTRLTKDKIIQVIEAAKHDQWIIDGGFSLLNILSDYQLNKLLNGRQVKSYSKPLRDLSNGYTLPEGMDEMPGGA